MRKTKVLNVLLIITNILNILFLILSGIVDNNNMFDYYWFTTPLILIFLVLIINEWSKEGLNSDINKSKIINRSFSDITTIIVVIFGLIFLILMFFNSIEKGIINNLYVMIGFTIITIIAEIFTYVSISSARKETIELLKQQHNIK